jgi:D-sedoheptulose 7-phosphate isomerase
VRDEIYTWLNVYVNKQKAALDSIPMDKLAMIIERVANAWKNDRQIFVFGNGGSAANASHFATDMFRVAHGERVSSWMKRNPARCMSLTDNVPWITATSNDFKYADIFVRQLMTFARPHDMVIGLSVSGNSENVVSAFEWAVTNNLEVIALVGTIEQKNALMLPFANYSIKIDESHYGRVEDVQMAICHMIAYIFKEKSELFA